MLRATAAGAVLSTALFAWLATTGSPSSAAEEHAISIAHYSYLPAQLEVHVGDVVTWTNTDDAPHTITSSAGPDALDSPELGKGESWQFFFTTAGQYLYYCTVHPDMKASVDVAPS